jgi:hypothetical protein
MTLLLLDHLVGMGLALTAVLASFAGLRLTQPRRRRHAAGTGSGSHGRSA